jgi:hypothetical protein
MEFLIVKFDEDRGVIVNDAPGARRTNKVFQLQAGTYIITLAAPPNFAPTEIEVELTGTNVLAPMEVTFTKV